jgi:hypothetical protein
MKNQSALQGSPSRALPLHIALNGTQLPGLTHECTWENDVRSDSWSNEGEWSHCDVVARLHGKGRCAEPSAQEAASPKTPRTWTYADRVVTQAKHEMELVCCANDNSKLPAEKRLQRRCVGVLDENVSDVRRECEKPAGEGD